MDENQSQDIGQDMLDDISSKTKSAGNSVVRKATNGASKLGRKAVKGAGKVAMKAGKAIASKLLAIIVPYIPVILGIIIVGILIIGAFLMIYDFEINSRGSGKRFESESNNPVSEGESGYFSTDTPNAENRAIAQLYKYFSENSYYQVIVDTNGSVLDGELKKPEVRRNEQGEDEVPIIDFLNREKLFYLPYNLLFTIDDTLYGGDILYPEQIVKPIKHNPDTFVLEQLTDMDADGNRTISDTTVSKVYGTNEYVVGVWDYGLAPIFKYFETERYEKVQATVIKKDVVKPNPNVLDKNSYTLMVDIPESEQREIDAELPNTREAIYLMDSATTFAGNFHWTYTFNEEEMGMRIRGLTKGAESRNEVSDAEFVIIEEKPVYDWVEHTRVYYIPYSGINNVFYFIEQEMIEGIYIIESQNALYYMVGGTIRRAYISGAPELTMIDELGGSYSFISSIHDLPLGAYADKEAEQSAIAVGATDYRVLSYQIGEYGGIVVKYELYEYVKTLILREMREGGVVEYMPRVQDETIENLGDRYFVDYFADYSTWIPTEFSEGVDFENRVGTLLNISLNVGSNAKYTNKAFTETKRFKTLLEGYSGSINDAQMIQAIFAYDYNQRIVDKKLYTQSLEDFELLSTSDKQRIDINGISNVGMDPDTGLWGVTYNGVSYTKEDRMIEEKSIELAVNKMSYLQDKYPAGEYSNLVPLLAYNWGTEAVDSFIAKYPTDFQDESITWLNYKEDFFMEYFEGQGNHELFNLEFIEDVLSYYDGQAGYNELNNYVNKDKTIWGTIFEKISAIFSDIKGNFETESEHFYFKNNLKGDEIYDMALMSLTFADGNDLPFSEFSIDEIPYWNFDDIVSMLDIPYTKVPIEDIQLLIPNLADYGNILQVSAPITSPFGPRTHPVTGEPNKMHWGADVGIQQGTELFSPSSGYIKSMGEVGTYGNLIAVELDDGVIVRFAHCSAFASGLTVGTRVSKGQLVAYSGGAVGSTGAGRSSGPHLHFEVIVNSAEYKGFIDPFYVVNNPNN